MGKIYFKSVQYAGGFGDTYVYPIVRSTEEREVGAWTDGKPLYEKSYEGTISSTQQDIEDFGQTTITLVSGVGMVAKTTGSQMAIGMLPSANNWQSGLHVASNTLKLFTTSEVSGGTYRITIRYTKASDTAGSGRWTPQGVPTTHYSLAEQVVGTWVNGSTIYEKTIYHEGGVQSATVDVAHGISNLGRVLSVETSIEDANVAGQYFLIPRVTNTTNDNLGINKVDGTYIYFVTSTALQNRLVNWYITIRYTKTST